MVNKNSKGLGRGIDALFSEYSDLDKIDISSERVQEIKLEDIRPNPYQPRKTFDEEALNELAR
jgi:ParB family chromosome partitioning protein